MIMPDTLFDALTPLGFRVRAMRFVWDQIVTIKHPIMFENEREVRDVLHNPDEVRRSRSDLNVYLFYQEKRPGRWICAVAKRTDGEGFLITAYPTDAIKEGERIWIR